MHWRWAGDKPLPEPVVTQYMIESSCPKELTYCGLVTSYGDRDLGQYWLR